VQRYISALLVRHVQVQRYLGAECIGAEVYRCTSCTSCIGAAVWAGLPSAPWDGL
jgi:hypothetical protein